MRAFAPGPEESHVTIVAVLHARLLDRLSFLSTTAAVGSLIWAAVLGSKVFLVLGLLLLAEGLRAFGRERRRSNAQRSLVSRPRPRQ